MVGFLFSVGETVIVSRIRFFQIGFFKQFFTARTDLRW
jgi:hypothetical protein